MYYDPLIDLNHTLPSSGNWIGWGFYLLPNDREMAQRFYEAATQGCLVEKTDGTAHMVAIPGKAKDDPYITALTLSLANELGDTEVVKKMRAHVEAQYEPTWDRESGEFYYLFGLREPYPRGQYNANIMIAEVAEPGAWWRLFNEPNLARSCCERIPVLNPRSAVPPASACRIWHGLATALFSPMALRTVAGWCEKEN